MDRNARLTSLEHPMLQSWQFPSVVVRRTKPDGLREITVKEFHVRDGEFYLRPRSRVNGYQELKVGRPDPDGDDDDEVAVVAFVVGTIPENALRILERMGKVRRI